MKLDREQKKARMGDHIPGFPGYRNINPGETDLQLRRLLAGEMEKVRDRLAEFIAGADLGDLQERFALALRITAALKADFWPRGKRPAVRREIPHLDEERLLDLDLALLEKIAALHTPLDRLEATGSPAELEKALEWLREGLMELGELFRQRGEILAERRREGGGR
jgi:hypothetical protein